VVVGPLSDRHGRRPFIVGGAALAGTFSVLGALAPSYGDLFASRVLAGLGVAVVPTLVMAVLADHYPYRERGTAVATLFTANAFGSLAGLALAGVIAEQVGWRVPIALSGGSLLAAAVVAWMLLPRHVDQASPEGPTAALYLGVLRDRSAVGALLSDLLGGVAATTWLTFVVVFLQTVHGVPQGLASAYALVQTAGVLIGAQAGGRLGHRIGFRRSFVIGSVVYAAAVMLCVSGSSPLAVVLGLLFTGSVGLGFRGTANATILSEQVSGARGTVLALSGVAVALGGVVAGSAGGLLVDTAGFPALGFFCAVTAIAGAVVTQRLVRAPDDGRGLSAAPGHDGHKGAL
jgi:DHA1 family chloramphenicol resistance protein-like MFS transporter